jgi:two-component system chemotaxis response regulator CheY
MRQLQRTILSMLEIEIEEAPNGAEAFSILLKSHFNLLITDLKMSPLDGAQLILALQILPLERRPKIIVCSSDFSGPTQTEREALRKADWLLTKPFAAADLIAAVRSVLPSASLLGG